MFIREKTEGKIYCVYVFSLSYKVRISNTKLIGRFPGYCGIVGNEFEAKNAGSRSVFFTDNLNWRDLTSRINRHYTEIDKDNTKSHTSSTINKEKNIGLSISWFQNQPIFLFSCESDIDENGSLNYRTTYKNYQNLLQKL